MNEDPLIDLIFGDEVSIDIFKNCDISGFMIDYSDIVIVPLDHYTHYLLLKQDEYKVYIIYQCKVKIGGDIYLNHIDYDEQL